MRRSIYKTLSKIYDKNILEIIEIIKSTNQVLDLNKINLNNGREGIDKTNLNKNDNIVLDYYMHLLRVTFNVKYPNRDNSVSNLYQILPYINSYRKFTIYKFDFKDFFNSVETDYFVTTLLFNNDVINKQEFMYLKKHLIKNNTIVGIGLSNCVTEILGKQFDYLVKQYFIDKGLIYYDRYIDDGIIILDEVLSEESITIEIKKYMSDIFGSKIKLNDEKKIYSTKEDKNDIDFDVNYLGYRFIFKESRFITGIEDSKILKNNNKIEKFILDYSNDKNIDKLLLRIDNIYKRTVVLARKKGKDITWQVRGVTYNYRQLRNYLVNQASIRNDYLSDKCYKQMMKHQTDIDKGIKHCKQANQLPNLNLKKMENNQKIDTFRKKEKNKFYYMCYEKNCNNIDKKTLDFLLGENIISLFKCKNIECPNQIINLVKNNYYLSIFYNNKANLYYSKIGYSEFDLVKIINKIAPDTKSDVLKSMSYADKVAFILKKLY